MEVWSWKKGTIRYLNDEPLRPIPCIKRWILSSEAGRVGAVRFLLSENPLATTFAMDVTATSLPGVYLPL